MPSLASRSSAVVALLVMKNPLPLPAAEMKSAMAVRRNGYLRHVPDDRPCGQGGDDPERQIHQQQVSREHRPAAPKSEIPRAAHRQEKQKQGQHWRQEVEKSEKVQVRP